MKREELKKRLFKIEGIPLKPYVLPRSEMRRESNKISLTDENDIKFETFSDFEEDLTGMEAARQQFERIEEERILYEQRMRTLGVEIDEPQESFFEIDDQG